MIRHGGDRTYLAQLAHCDPEEILDFSVNLHPLGMPDGLPAVLQRALNKVGPYPEPHAESLSRLAGEKWNRPAGEFLFGNGSSELLELLPRVLPCRQALIVTPGYLEYARSCEKAGLTVREFPLHEERDFVPDLTELVRATSPGELVIMGNPDNPTGVTVPAASLWETVKEHGELFFLIDEAFAEFSGETLLDLPPLPNLFILRSLTKFYAMAGVRAGFICGPESWIDAMRELQTTWSVGTVAAEAAAFLLSSAVQDRAVVDQLREEFASGFRKAGLKVYPSRANYLLCRSERPLFKALLEKRIAVRECSNYPGLDEHYFRAAVRSCEDNEKLLQAIAPAQAPYIACKRPKPALMLQGTCSNAGKSVLAAAFCRILLQDGFSVAPFKAQNMALNSFVTPDGGEIGRAQAVQAEACRLDPDVRMNPILLKPDSDLGSQVVVMGHPVGNYKVRDYFRKKKELWREVTAAYDSLASEHDCVVLEGAGSPGEVNLKSSDIVNMNMAKYARAPVILTGDIDRGGVYASFIGTWMTLEPGERELLYGFLVNKFRGDPTLLRDAHTYVEKMTGKPVLGVIDYQHKLGLPEEDSVGFSFAAQTAKDALCLDAAVIHVGHVSNFTDFAPLEQEPDVRLRIVEEGEELGDPDLILLPGSKSVAGDMEKLRQSGLWEKLKQSRAYFCGICGGLQMLGKRICDPEHVESAGSFAEGLGLLPLETVMAPEKTLLRTRSFCGELGESSGYEIHHGRTRALAETVAIHRSPEGRETGFEKGNCFGTYLHGIFDDDRFRRAFLNRLRKRKNWPETLERTHYGIEEALNRLAGHVRSRVDLKKLYRRMGL